MNSNELPVWFMMTTCAGILIFITIAILSPLFAARENQYKKTLRELLLDKGNQVILFFVIVGFCALGIAAFTILSPMLTVDHNYIATKTLTP